MEQEELEKLEKTAKILEKLKAAEKALEDEDEKQEDVEKTLVKMMEIYDKQLTQEEQANYNKKMIEMTYSIAVVINQMFMMLNNLETMERLKAIPEFIKTFTEAKIKGERKNIEKISDTAIYS